MTYSRVFKFFSTIILIILAVYTSSKGLGYFLISSFSFLLFIYYFIAKGKIDFWFQSKGWKSLNWLESLANGGIKEAQIYRPLTDFEKQILGYRLQETKDNNFDLDLRSPVFRIIGELSREGNGENEVAQVRGFKLSRKNLPDQKYQFFNEGVSVGVEFSPFSKTVWDIYAVLGNKRIWQMNFPEKSISDIRSGKRTVDLRAPYGDHNLEQIKENEYITFSDKFRLISITVQINRITFYKTLAQAVSSEGPENILPETEYEEVLEHFKNLPSYEARIKQSGVYALKFKAETPQEITNLLRYVF